MFGYSESVSMIYAMDSFGCFVLESELFFFVFLNVNKVKRFGFLYLFKSIVKSHYEVFFFFFFVGFFSFLWRSVM